MMKIEQALSFVKSNKWLLLVLGYLGLMLAVKQSFLTYDLGRHLTTGRVFFEKNTIVNTNFYSYTDPDKMVINHHWLAGVLFYLIVTSMGFVTLSIVYVVLSVLAVAMMAWVNDAADDLERALAVFLVAPLLYTRTEIRPEVFTYFFVGLLWFFYGQIQKKRLSYKWLLLWPVVMTLWVNMHIYFFVGWVLGVLLIERLYKKSLFSAKFGLVLIGLFSGAMFVNPNGFNGVIYPLSILSGYGYAITENQPVLEYLKYIRDPNVYHYVVVAMLLLLSGLYVWIKKKVEMWDFLVVVLFGLFSWFMMRNIWFLAMLVLVIGTKWWLLIADELKVGKGIRWLALLVVGVLAVGTMGISEWRYYWPNMKVIGLGVDKRIVDAGDWIENHDVSVRLFNNYDIGGFLIYAGYPKLKVFVDNRPEAYSSEFFADYIRLQSDERYWKSREFEFDTIVFAYTDQTPWAKPFLTRRADDPNWEMIYKDNLGMVVFIKTVEEQ